MKTYNSWMMLSKLTTAKRREAMAAAETRDRVTMRRSEAVLATVAGEMFVGRGYAVVGMAGDVVDVVQTCRIIFRL